MKLACNYYEETCALAVSGAIEIDYFKFPALGFQMDILSGNYDRFCQFVQEVSMVRPLLLHGLYPGPLDVSSPSFTDDFIRTNADDWLAAAHVPGVSVHPCAGPPDGALPDNITDTIVHNLRFLAERYKRLKFVSVENMDARRYGPMLDAAFITDIVERSGVSFLLDISHAFCASFFRGEDFYEYLKKLPLSRVSEIHINGWYVKGGDVMCHLKINEEGYRALAYVLDYCMPQIVTIEYGRHNDRLGIGCPLMSPAGGNTEAMAEITEQVEKVRTLIGR